MNRVGLLGAFVQPLGDKDCPILVSGDTCARAARPSATSAPAATAARSTADRAAPPRRKPRGCNVSARNTPDQIRAKRIIGTNSPYPVIVIELVRWQAVVE